MVLRRAEIIDLEDLPRYIRQVDDYAPPEVVGSGVTPPRPPNLPKFPNNTELVIDESNSELLAALLPVLNKYQCLQFTTEKRRRSPWVRAFCDLYHPAGPWGSNKFSNAPDITSNRKYKFKSYQIPTLYKQLQKYQGEFESHLELKAALRDYFGKEAWHKEFLQGCELVAAVEVNKPVAERAAIPSLETGVAVGGGSDVADDATASAKDANDDSTAASTPRRNPGRRKRKSTPELGMDPPLTRSQRCKSFNQVDSPLVKEEEEAELVEEKETSKILSTKPSVAREAVSPEQASGEQEEKTKESLELKRSELIQLLSRRSSSNGHKDAIGDKIQKQIDKIDEELLEMILG